MSTEEMWMELEDKFRWLQGIISREQTFNTILSNPMMVFFSNELMFSMKKSFLLTINKNQFFYLEENKKKERMGSRIQFKC